MDLIEMNRERASTFAWAAPVIAIILVGTLAGCALVVGMPTPTPTPTAVPPTATATPIPPTPTPQPPTATPSITPTATLAPGEIPALGRVFFVIFENREFTQVIGNESAPNFNSLAEQGALLTQHYAITHPSFPNYLALIAGQTFGITWNCETCYQNAPILPDQLEASGKTWRAYLEGMPAACFDYTVNPYAKRHNPFIYFESVRSDEGRCLSRVVPFDQFVIDMSQDSLPDFVWITPDICNSAHDCPLATADKWLGSLVDTIRSSNAYQSDSLIIITWDEGSSNAGCCDLAKGGRVATILLSPMIQPGVQDDTPYTHYSLLAMLEKGWGLDLLGLAGDPRTTPVNGVWGAAP
jgi:hypothetical protein